MRSPPWSPRPSPDVPRSDVPTILVYRDTVGVRSESFIQRQYKAFHELEPIYVGTKRGPLAPKDALILAAPGLAGAYGRTAFRQWGHIPAKLDRVVATRKPALIHAQFGLGGALALPLVRHTGLPLVVTFHGGDATKEKHFDERKLLPTIFQRRRRAMAETAHTILCVSQFVRDRLIARGFPAGKLQTHYLGIDIPPEVVLPPLGVSDTVLFVGRLVEKKGVDTLIEAMAVAKQTYPALELSVVGDGSARGDLERRAKETGIAVRFHGWLPEKKVHAAMRRALLLAVPSRTADGGDSEGLPTVIMEAMALGVPVVASRHAGVPEIVSDGVTGLLAAEADPTLLAQAILSLKTDSDLAGRLRAEAYADVRARFDADRQSALLERKLLEIIGASSR
ncbi:MAG: glycosyl transferase, group 1 [Rhodospirillales bacterium]|nr:glycosyl transferase, group 1 [Rhodospirillales bacterium]